MHSLHTSVCLRLHYLILWTLQICALPIQFISTYIDIRLHVEASTRPLPYPVIYPCTHISGVTWDEIFRKPEVWRAYRNTNRLQKQARKEVGTWLFWNLYVIELLRLTTITWLFGWYVTGLHSQEERITHRQFREYRYDVVAYFPVCFSGMPDKAEIYYMWLHDGHSFSYSQVTENDQVVFRCRVISEPEATLQWFHNGRKVRPSSNFLLSAGKLFNLLTVLVIYNLT